MGKEKSQHRQHQLLQLSHRIVTLPGAQARNMTSRCVPVSATISSEVEARLSLPVQLANLPEPGRTFIGKTRSLCSQMCPTVAAPFPTSAQSCCLIILLKSRPQLASGSQMCSRLSLSCIFCGAGATGCVTGCLALGLTPPPHQPPSITNPGSGSSLASSPERPSGPLDSHLSFSEQSTPCSPRTGCPFV